MTFSDFSLARELVSATGRLGFLEPTPIQRESIPPALQGRDILASAETGSGKTAAFLLPIMDRLLEKQRGATRALVLAPTRELAAQIAEHFQALAQGTRLSCAAVYGGVGMGGQERAFRKGVDLIVACPGRLLDHMRGPHVDFSCLEFLVLDEADRMLDMGFLPDIKRVLAALPRDRQTLFFSATLPAPIVTLSREMLRNPAHITIGRKQAPATGISHAAFAIQSERKPDLLLELLRGDIKGSVLVFTRTKHRANRLAEFLVKHGVECARIHGNRSQSQRALALSGFKRGEYRVLVATDIAARGIDVEALGHVVNFDVPHQPEDYIHRVGRTARAQLTGEAYTFVSPDEEKDFSMIERALGKRLPRKASTGLAVPAEAAGRSEPAHRSEPAGGHEPAGRREAARGQQSRNQQPRSQQSRGQQSRGQQSRGQQSRDRRGRGPTSSQRSSRAARR